MEMRGFYSLPDENLKFPGPLVSSSEAPTGPNESFSKLDVATKEPPLWKGNETLF